MSDPEQNDFEGPKRTNAVFRQLIDQMLNKLREASHNQMWTPEARARAEADLTLIMESVRREALGDTEKED